MVKIPLSANILFFDEYFDILLSKGTKIIPLHNIFFGVIVPKMTKVSLLRTPRLLVVDFILAWKYIKF